MKGKCGVRLGVCVLAGGLSTRMGRDKAILRLGRRTILGEIRMTAVKLALPLRVIRQDLVLPCGPLGGIYTSLQTSRADAELFLACDMPFVSAEFLRQMIADFRVHKEPVFAITKGAGFPFLLPQKSLSAVEEQIQKRQFSLQSLAKCLRARLIQPSATRREQLFNINTPDDLKQARHQWRQAHPVRSRDSRLKKERTPSGL
jgi:molybdopterin-guanine dinucleotide biosynthesis protein A